MVDQSPEHDAAQHWESHAAEWTRWAREPGHDVFWSYRERFREFVPAPGASTLEIGCGEGRISRELTDLGHRVTATDISPSLLAAAEQAGSADRYRLADAADLPFDDGEFDRVVAYNVLMDVPDMPAAVAEAARVLAPGGHLTISIVHPFIDRGAFADDGPEAVFEVRGSYYERKHFVGTEQRGGHVMHFAGWSHPLHDYTAALTDAGLAITALHEPRPGEAGNGDAAVARWNRLPLFLWLDATHLR
ncbi:class I SAM-dependent methyltransferase [Pseudonocardia kunmingensis]|uniref:Pimeloyl-CoA biosynthesis protein BioC n=1 Tax=Pseudonocardia kunmingensis TaxID=630975 RepID=A0A543CYM5_9PSEU|nr:class I SAM-dependent methyltransferase [Pseudonocardia kunmingensis]TQM02203.1 pimeloyl-CoA biosynthesis protein BioC [Pseudonocardia kunmingensis]